MKKLLNMNGHYIREADDARLAGLVAPLIGPEADVALLTEAMPVLKTRARDLNELADGAAFLFKNRPLGTDRESSRHCSTTRHAQLLAQISERLRG